MQKIVVRSVFLMIFLGLIKYGPSSEFGYIFLGGLIYDSIIIEFWKNPQNAALYFKSKSPKYRNKYIRLSISYLFRIKVDNKYLLIRGERITGQFQPVGGVYKMLPEAKSTLGELGVRDDNNIQDKISKDDLRIRVKGKYLMKFLNWYDSGKERENSNFREFCEELLEPGILSKEVFPYINTRHIKRHQTDIRYSNHFQCPEILIAEIYELIPNEEQEQKLRELMNKDRDKYIWVNEETILKRGVTDQNFEAHISETSEWII